MPVLLTDEEISGLTGEPKTLPPASGYLFRTRLRPGHQEWLLDVTGSRGSEFRVILRRSTKNPLDFSVVLAYGLPGGGLFRLRRYNGRSHLHTNSLEGDQFGLRFHIHEATERYQQEGYREETYATPTDRYADLQSALLCMLQDCAFEVPPGWCEGFSL